MRQTRSVWTLAAAALLPACATAPKPALDTVDPPLFCEEAGATLTLRGDGLGVTVVDGLTDHPEIWLPEIAFEPIGGVAAGSPPSSTRVVVVPSDSPRLHAVDAKTMEVDIDAGLGLEPGQYAVVVRTAAGVEARLEPGFVVVGPPIVTETRPSAFCHDLPSVDATLVGSGFLVIDGAVPAVDVGGIPATAVAGGDCEPIAAPGSGEVCTTLEITSVPTTLPFGATPLHVTNPPPAACASVDSASVDISPPPDAIDVAPDWVCNQRGSFRLHGMGFSPYATVTIRDLPVESVTWEDAETLYVQVGSSDYSGTTDVTVIDGGGCADSLSAVLTVVDPPVVYWVDPPTTWNGATTSVTALVANATGAIVDARLEDGSGNVVSRDWTWDPERPGEVTVTVPKGLPEGEYAVVIQEDGGCDGTAAATLQVEASADVSVASVDPPFGWTFTQTPADVYTDDPVPAGKVPFADSPRLYLVGPSGTTVRVLGLAYEDPNQLRVVIPDSLEPGAWDVLVVNPDGAIGWLEDGVTITPDPPPTITTVNPGRLDKSADQPVVIQGKDFDDPSVSIECLQDGVTSAATARVTTWAYSRIDAVIPTTSFDRAVCVVRVTNADGAFARYSAISIANPSENLFRWSAGTNMVVPRRAPAGASGRTNSISRYVYAIGGDNGTTSGPTSSVEVASIGVYGEMGEWSLLPDTLPSARTLAASAVIGRFIYVVGGNIGGAPQSGVLRAMILDPLDVPYLDSVLMSEDASATLEPGVWSYRIAALYDASYAANPWGESMSTDPVTVVIPDLGDTMVPTISWTPIDGAVAYRVYRTPSPDSPSGTEEWVDDVVGTSFTDTGYPTWTAHLPKPEGSVGTWHSMPYMNAARESACVAVAPDPIPDPEVMYLYAAGGWNGSSALSSIERLPITIEGPDVQTPGVWEKADVSLSDARFQCFGYTVDTSRHTIVDEGESWVMFAGGTNGRKSFGTVDAGLVADGGGLDDWQQAEDMNPGRAGFAGASASNTLYGFGGQNAGPHAGSTSGILADPMPTIENWNSLGTSLSEPRYLPGAAQESAVIFVLGGSTDSAGATRTTDTTAY